MFLQSLRADLIPVTVALQNDGLDTPANLAAFGSLEYMLDPGAGPDWTTEQNNFLLQNLLVLVTTLGGDTTQIAALFAPGAVFADVLTPPLPSLTGPVVFSSAQTPADVPEPATIGLLGGALLLLSFYATRRLRNIYLHGPLQRSD
ncbi:MAG TPA: PEP-CTERM sorting domain-containing protein [Bryobacteraceae bacterium]|nr:PEP-CTERM sorting domain-containing protein [Bryobacteraceae bacterium]